MALWEGVITSKPLKAQVAAGGAQVSVQCFMMQSIQHVEETRREEGRERPCESSKTSLDNRQQDQSLDKGAVCISNLSFVEQRGGFRQDTCGQ